jgi:hypothetical protein
MDAELAVFCRQKRCGDVIENLVGAGCCRVVVSGVVHYESSQLKQGMDFS